MTRQTTEPSAEPRQQTADAEAYGPFQLDIRFIENTPATETMLMCSTGDTCGSSCPSACTTS